MKIIKGHIAVVDSEDLCNPFLLSQWANECGAKGYTEYIGLNYRIAFVTKEDKDTIMCYNDVIISYSQEELDTYDKEIVENSVIITPITDMGHLPYMSTIVTKVW